MEREYLMDDIEDIQDKVDRLGYRGANEYDLALREEIADYIERLLAKSAKES
jgi:hypothetical protein